LVNQAPPIHAKLGGTSYEQLIDEINQAMTYNVKGIVFVHNSGGGQVSGNKEVAELIAELPLPTVAYCDIMACSASYKIAVASDSVIASPSAIVGNVGTLLSYVDNSQMMDVMDVKIMTITSEGATWKDTLHRLPLTDEQFEFLQDDINQSGKEFTDFVRKQQPNINEVFVKAGWYKGSRAMELGFVDSLDSLDSIIAQFRAYLG